MNKLYLVPDRGDMDRMCSLAKEYGCAFEYNDFFKADVMENPEKQREDKADNGKYRQGGGQEKMHEA